MSKRFFSLLLVLVMVFALAAPALAANDGISTIERGNWDSAVAATTAKDGMKALDAALRLHQASGHAYSASAYDWSYKLNGNETYTAASWTAFANAMEAGLDLVDQYESNWDIADSQYQAAADAIATAYATLDKRATTQDKNDYAALVSQAEALLVSGDLTTKAYNDLKTALDNANGKAVDHKGYAEPTNPDNPIANPGGAIAILKAALDDAQRGLNQRSLKFKAVYDDRTSGQEAGQIRVTIDDLKPGDENTYVLYAKLNNGEEYRIDEMKPTQATKVGDPLIATKEYLHVSDFADAVAAGKVKFESTDVVTLTLKYKAPNERGDTNTEVVYQTITLSCVYVPPTQNALALTAKGFVGDLYAVNDMGHKIDAAGVELPVGVGASQTTHNFFYFVLNQELKNAFIGYTADTKAVWRIKGAAGETVGTEITATTSTDKIFYLDLPKGQDRAEAAKMKPGAYTLELVVKGSAGATDRVIFTDTIQLPALDTAPLTQFLSANGLSDRNTLAANYGPYAKTTKLMEAVTEAQKFISSGVAATEVNVKTLGRAAQDFNILRADKDNNEGHQKMPRNTCFGHFLTISKAYQAVIDLRPLKVAIDQGNSMNKNAYPNWNPGLMKIALANAIAAYNALTTDFDKSYDSKFDADGDGVKETVVSNYTFYIVGDKDYTQATYRTGVTKDNIGSASYLSSGDVLTLTSELTTAIKWLNDSINPDEKDGILPGDDGRLYYFEGGKSVGSGVVEYPEGSGIFYYCSVTDGHVLRDTGRGGWITGADGKRYYANSNGVLTIGYKKIGADGYYFSVKDGHMMKNGWISGQQGKNYIAAKDGKLYSDKTTITTGSYAGSYYCSVKDNHVFRAVSGTAWVTGTVAKYQVNEKGIILDSKPLKG